MKNLRKCFQNMFYIYIFLIKRSFLQVLTLTSYTPWPLKASWSELLTPAFTHRPEEDMNLLHFYL